MGRCEFNFSKTKNRAFTVVSMAQLASKGKTSKLDIWNLHPWPGRDDLFTVQYTSGSTGQPKGVMIPHAAYLAQIMRPYGMSGIMFSYEPLAHSTRRNDQTGILHGCRIGFHSGDMEKLFEEIQIIRPTAIAGVPRVWNKIFAEYQKTLHLALASADSKQKYQLERDTLRRFRALLGDRLAGISCGGAPTSPAVLNFLKRCFRCAVMDSYGATETGGISIDSKIDNAGGTSTHVQIKLADWDEFKSTDNPPRGELLVKSKALAVGYYNNATETEESFRDGWFHTGDIVRLEADGRVKVIGRKKQIFKLSQGEYISPERIENTFLRSPFVEQVFVHGDSIRTFLVAVVVVNVAVLMAELRCKNIAIHEDSIVHSAEAKDLVLSDLIRCGGIGQLLPFELPVAIHLTEEPFTIHNGLLTSTNKLNRSALSKHYSSAIQSMYFHEADSINVEDLASKIRRSKEKDILGALENVLDLRAGTGESSFRKKTFQELGGDSIGAVRLRHLCKENFAVDVSIQQIFESSSVEELLKHITRLQKSDDALVAEATQKFQQFDRGHSSSLDLPSEVDLLPSVSHDVKSILDSISDLSIPPKDKFLDGHILLTGATGFIGTHLLAELLNGSAENVLVYCLVRPDGSQSSSRRLRRSLKRSKLWNSKFKGRISVVEGDLTQPQLGIESALFEELLVKIEHVYHNGALVNAVLGYSDQHRVNVFGTAEIIRFCASKRPKVLHHVSTLSVFKPASGGIYCTESTPLSSIPKPPLSDAYARTKYEAEELVLKSRERGLEANIYRLGSISGHRETGVSNKTDFLTRLLAGIPTLGIPEGCLSVHFELTPVDFATKALVCISRDAGGYHKNYHITSKPRQFALIVPLFKELGYALETHVWDAWHADLLEAPDNPLYPLLHYFESNSWPWARECDGWFADSLVKKAGIQLQEDFSSRLRMQLAWMKAQGLLPNLSHA
eukprot:TRINITY_DN1946_c0_g1_i2.p1 TRINITY_DN1946_c0_g1~~TRINITY_DN1946_c0_g1_i2.p1  ORF type:complete len:958 (-),score=94.72 TRINITY_DN1946_c0_g1_i2:1203-4076(-)